MTTNFLIKALDKQPFISLMGSTEAELLVENARWISVDSNPGYPCRVSLIDAEIGERVLALPFWHHQVNSPYRASGPIFIRERAETVKLEINTIPNLLRHRMLSVRAYSLHHNMQDAEVTQGSHLEKAIKNQLKNDKVSYLHIHNAAAGCFNCAVYRA